MALSLTRSKLIVHEPLCFGAFTAISCACVIIPSLAVIFPAPSILLSGVPRLRASRVAPLSDMSQFMNPLDTLAYSGNGNGSHPPAEPAALPTAPASPPRLGKRLRRARALPAVKNFVLDTNVLLHDPHSFQRFKDNHVWIPVDVLAELDKFKNEQSERGANARAVHRAFSRIFAGP